MTPRASSILAELHATPALAPEVFDALKVANAWTQVGQDWCRYSVCWTGDLDAFGKERPIGRVFEGADGKWHSPSHDSHFATAVVARMAVDSALLASGWALVDPQEMQW